MPIFSKSFVKCDRCGEIREEQKGIHTMWIKFQSFNGRKQFSEGEKHYYLCIDCEKAFIDWFCDNSKVGSD